MLQLYILERIREEELMEQPQFFYEGKRELLKLIYARLDMIKRARKHETILVTEMNKDYEVVRTRSVEKLTKARV